MSETHKWWLISDELRILVEQALCAPTHEANQFNCQDWPLETGCRGCRGDELRKKARYEFDVGLHTADRPPSDFAEEADDA